MSLRGRLIGLLLTVFASPMPAFTQIELPKASPKAVITQRIGLTDVTVEYSSPAVGGRKIWGELVPFGEIWRTGANECTKFRLSKDAALDGKQLAAGEYCLFTIPERDEWTLIINRDSKLSGVTAYDVTKDVLRVKLKPEASEFRERLGFEFEDFGKSDAKLSLVWEKLALKIPLSFNTREQALQNIQTLKSTAWRDYADAARYQLEEEKNLAEALKLAERSIELEKTWFNHWIKAQVLAGQGKKTEAAKFAGEALALGDDSGFFKAYEARIKTAAGDWKD